MINIIFLLSDISKLQFITIDNTGCITISLFNIKVKIIMVLLIINYYKGKIMKKSIKLSIVASAIIASSLNASQSISIQKG